MNADSIRLRELEKELESVHFSTPLQSGFEYGTWPVLIPTPDKKDFNIVSAHWELIPPFVFTGKSLEDFRSKYDTLNAKGETILSSRIYREPALKGRCLIPSTGFYEWRHIHPLGKSGQPLKTPVKYPYYIRLKDCSYFFIAGISQPWTDRDTGETFDTFSLVTTEANSLMAQIHNKKKRMPVILPEAQAYEWLFDSLSEKRISELATYQIGSEALEVTTLRKDFRNSGSPSEPFTYPDLPALV